MSTKMHSQQTEFSAFLVHTRKTFFSRQLTQAEFAKKLGCSRNTISRLENDECRPSLVFLENLGNLISMPLPDLTKIVKSDRSNSNIAITSTPAPSPIVFQWTIYTDVDIPIPIEEINTNNSASAAAWLAALTRAISKRQ